jgi:hypothetical protein
MAKADVLDRVAADLSRGQTQPAIRRLGSLVAAHPTDLDLRRRLAAVHRLVGNAVEAGRWSYLNADADPTEILAFERAHPSPGARLRKLCWPAQEAHAATEFARDRIAALTAAQPHPANVRPAGRRPATSIAAAVVAPRWRYRLIALIVALPFAVVGAITVVQWIVG